jgi:preprotein translocase subunit SecG
MLSFLREQGCEDSKVQETAKSSNGEAKNSQDLKSPKPSDKAKEQQYLTVAAQGKNVRKMTMLLVVLFVIGLLCLWIMIKKSAPRTATASSAGTEETQIEKAIARLTGVGSEMFKRMDQIVKKFYEFSDVRQVRVSELVKNPFERQIFLADAKKRDDSKKVELLRPPPVLQLLVIWQTDEVYSCMINDKILYEGDTIKGFNVVQIGDDFVKLELEGVERVLKLSE